jgi:hypothetical protein
MLFSPSAARFRNCVVDYPGVLSACIIDWFHKWPVTALTMVTL